VIWRDNQRSGLRVQSLKPHIVALDNIQEPQQPNHIPEKLFHDNLPKFTRLTAWEKQWQQPAERQQEQRTDRPVNQQQ
jgi:hypothetical protein